MAILSQLSPESSELSSESSSSSSSGFDIFLSFRGIDTRLTFTDHLHKALIDAYVDTFLDDEDIETGEDLKPTLTSAIKASRASVVVLSKNFASSTWCLDELVLILERRRTSGHIVIPIFYHVEPTDVRKQQSSFGDALVKHEQRMEAETNVKKQNQWAKKLELWKKALTEVADLKGEVAEGRRETEFIKEIVRKISNTIRPHLRRELPHLIGMQSSIETITSWLEDGSTHSADILTIWGLPGIGKTSLAKYVHRLHYQNFERSSFLEDIGRKCRQESRTLIDFQKLLLADISNKSSINVQDVDACTCMIEKSLFNKKVLLILDDIDSSRHLDALLGKKGFFPGSKIIITTNNRSLIEEFNKFGMNFQPKYTRHELKALGSIDSLRLLRRHAFRPDDPQECYDEILRKVVEYCGGHPLGLEVLGSSLRNKDINAWEDTLECLEKEVHPDIQKVLQISFDSLPNKWHKKLFKHIACFFIGKDREFTEKILKACDVCKPYGIQTLIERCLLSVGSKNELVMHQLLQDMGRDIVRQESPEKPWKRSLLWRREECSDVLKSKKGTTTLQGLALDMKMFEGETLGGLNCASNSNLEDDISDNFQSFSLLHIVHVSFTIIRCFFGCFGLRSIVHPQRGVFETNTFSKMCNLRLLQLNYVQLNGSYENFPKGLRWLCMHGFPLSFIPSDLPMENMVALDMSHSNLKQLWKNPVVFIPSDLPMHGFPLKFLNLSCEKLLRVGDFSRLPVLEELILAGCVSLIEVGESIGNCDRLVLLDLSDCKKLKKLPRSIGKLKNLRTLSIDGCASLCEIPVEMKDMESFKILNAKSISIKPLASSSAIAEAVPRSLNLLAISLPSSLVELSLKNNNLFTESFPTDLSSLSMLKVLCLSGNPIDSLPDGVRSLNRLEVLSLRECHMLKSVLCAPSRLTSLDVFWCDSLEKITFDQIDMSERPLVWYGKSKSLTEIEGIFKTEALAEMNEEILCSLGWINLHSVINQKVQMRFWKRDIRERRVLVQVSYHKYYRDIGERRVPAQVSYQNDILLKGGCYDYEARRVAVEMLYEYLYGVFKGGRYDYDGAHGVMSTCFNGKEIPEWITHRRKGPSISFTCQSSLTIRGLNVCFLQTFSDTRTFGIFRISIRNLTKDITWYYYPEAYVVGGGNEEEGIVWLSHWMFGNNEFEDGDEVTLTIGDPYYIKECGISVVSYEPCTYVVGRANETGGGGGGKIKEDPLGCYK